MAYERKHPDKHVVVIYPINELYAFDDILFRFFWQAGHHRCHSDPVVVMQNAKCIVNHVGPLFDGSIGLDLARHDALDKLRAHCLKTRLDIAGVVPVHPHDLRDRLDSRGS